MSYSWLNYYYFFFSEVLSATCYLMKLTKVTGANSHQNLSVVAGSAGFWRDNKGRKWEEKRVRVSW